MAEISDYTYQIANASYGEQVRGSIVSALNVMNNQLETSSSGAVQAASRAEAAADLSETIRAEFELDFAGLTGQMAAWSENENERIQNELDRINREAEREAAETGYVAQAKRYANEAAAHASSDYATAAKSWAIGSTNTRPEENINNAQYWASVAHSWAETAASAHDGVATFNQRSGNVVPQSGDYQASMISYGPNTVSDALDSVKTASDNAVTSIVRDGTSFRATKNDGTSFTFAQNNASSSSPGLMSAADKTALDNVTATTVVQAVAARNQSVTIGTVASGAMKNATKTLDLPVTEGNYVDWLPAAIRTYWTEQKGIVITGIGFPIENGVRKINVEVKNTSASDMNVTVNIGVLFYRVVQLGR